MGTRVVILLVVGALVAFGAGVVVGAFIRPVPSPVEFCRDVPADTFVPSTREECFRAR